MIDDFAPNRDRFMNPRSDPLSTDRTVKGVRDRERGPDPIQNGVCMPRDWVSVSVSSEGPETVPGVLSGSAGRESALETRIAVRIGLTAGGARRHDDLPLIGGRIPRASVESRELGLISWLDRIGDLNAMVT